MRSLQLIFFILACTALCVSGHIETGTGKADALRQLARDSPNGIIAFNSTGFRYFLLEQPRPYEVVIFFTAPKCDFCEQMKDQYETTARYYYENKGHVAYQDSSKKLRAVFYGEMVFEQSNRDIFLDLDFKSVPNIIVSQPKHAKVSDAERLNYLKGFKWQISGSDGLVTFHKLLEYVNKRTGRDIEYQPPVSEVIKGLSVFLLVIISSIAIFRLFKPFFLNTKLWFIGSLAIYFISIAGIIYIIIHNTPWTQVDQKGNLQWMIDSQRSQLGAEGFVMSGLFIVAAVSMISWQLFARIGQGKMLSKLMFLAVFGITLIVILKIEELYKYKGWYTIQFYPPAHYSHGPISKDQGNSI